MSRFPRASVITLSYLLIAVALTWPLAAHLNSGVTSSIDPVDSIWRIGWGHYRLLHNPLHLFTGNTFYPFADSYLFDELVLGSAVLTLPLALLHIAPLAIYNVALLLSLTMSAVAMYALARRFGAVPVAAFIAGVIYAFAPMHLDRIGHIGLLSAQWFPLILLLCDRIVAAPRIRDTLALAACVVMQAISSHYYAIYLLVLVPLFLAIACIKRPEARRRNVWLHFATAGALAFVIILPIAIGYRRVQNEYGVERTFGQTTYYAATVANFFTVDGRNRFWGGITAPLRTHGTYTFERNMFPGLLALLLAGFGFWIGRRRPWEQFLALLVGISAAFAVGPELRLTPGSKSLLLRHLPYDIFYWHLPGFASMRVPARFGTLFLLGIAGLAATGATALLARSGAFRLPRINTARAAPIAVAATLLAGFGAEYATRPLPIVPLESGETIPAVYYWLADQPDARVIELPLVIPDHEREQAIAVREQYYSLVHRRPIVNGNANVLPKGYKALAFDMRRFPSERSVALLQGLGITHVVVHFDQFPGTARAALAARLDGVPDEMSRSVQFGETSVYIVSRSAKLAELPEIVAPGASVRLSRNDPMGTGAYMGMLGYLLRDHPLYARLRVDFGQNYR
ncbi:MAG: hypothetical protein M3176_19325, partial [Chloroflexota bacterium]|nr:hypothetical protein [Chloroflexota bacterium]